LKEAEDNPVRNNTRSFFAFLLAEDAGDSQNEFPGAFLHSI